MGSILAVRQPFEVAQTNPTSQYMLPPKRLIYNRPCAKIRTRACGKGSLSFRQSLGNVLGFSLVLVLLEVLDRLCILFVACLSRLIPLIALAIDPARPCDISRASQGTSGRGAHAADTIGAAMPQQATADTQSICGLIGVVAVALAGQDRGGNTRGRVDASALDVGEATDVGRGARGGRVQRVWVGREDTEGQGLAAATIVGGGREGAD